MKTKIQTAVVALFLLFPWMLMAQEMEFVRKDYNHYEYVRYFNWQGNQTEESIILETVFLCNAPYTHKNEITGGSPEYNYQWFYSPYDSVFPAGDSIYVSAKNANYPDIVELMVLDSNGDSLKKIVNFYYDIRVLEFTSILGLYSDTVFLNITPQNVLAQGPGVEFSEKKDQYYILAEKAGLGTHEIKLYPPRHPTCVADTGNSEPMKIIPFTVNDYEPIEIQLFYRDGDHICADQNYIDTTYKVTGGLPPYQISIDWDGLERGYVDPFKAYIVSYSVVDSRGVALEGSLVLYGEELLVDVYGIPEKINKVSDPFVIDVLANMYTADNQNNYVHYSVLVDGNYSIARQIGGSNYEIDPGILPVGRHSIEVEVHGYNCMTTREYYFDVADSLSITLFDDNIMNLCMNDEDLIYFGADGGIPPYVAQVLDGENVIVEIESFDNNIMKALYSNAFDSLGNYTLRVYDATEFAVDIVIKLEGCEVEELYVFTDSAKTCVDEMVVLDSYISGGVAPYSYVWQCDECSYPLENATEAQLQFVSHDSGIFTVSCTVTDANGTVASHQNKITVHPGLIIEQERYTVYTNDNDFELGAGLNQIYSGTGVWSKNNAYYFSPAKAGVGTFAIAVENNQANYCQQKDTITITVLLADTCSVDAGFNYQYIGNNTYRFTALYDADEYQWQINYKNISNERSFEYTFTKTQVVTAILYASTPTCIDSLSRQIQILIEEPAQLSIQGRVFDCCTPVQCAQVVAYKIEGTTFISIDTVTVDTDGNYRIDGLTKGVYTVAALPCDEQQYMKTYFVRSVSEKDAIRIDLYDNATSVDILLMTNASTTAESFVLTDLQVYPNPMSEHVTIASAELTGATVTIVNAVGIEIAKLDAVANQVVFERGSIPSGIYSVIIIKQKQVIGMQKFIVK